MGAYSIYNLKSIEKSDMELYENMTVPLQEIETISTEFQRTRAIVRDMIIAQTPEDIQASIDKIMAEREVINEHSTSFESTILTEETSAAFEEYKIARVEFRKQVDNIIELAKQNRDAECVALMAANGASGKASIAYEDAINKKISISTHPSFINSPMPVLALARPHPRFHQQTSRQRIHL
jgi:methyl-accepting chemotaxis protein